MELSTAIEGCWKGSRAAQHCLFSRYAEQMFILCYRYVKNREDAEELMLNGFLSFFKSIARFQYNGEGSVAPWLRKIDQDTVRILRVFPPSDKKPDQARYVMLIFCLNDFREIGDYANDDLRRALGNLYEAAKKQTHWTPKNNHNMKLAASYSLAKVRQQMPADVHPAYRHNDYLESLVAVNVQNVYQYLSPSVSLGAEFVFPGGNHTHELRFAWEPMFLFGKDAAGKQQVFAGKMSKSIPLPAACPSATWSVAKEIFSRKILFAWDLEASNMTSCWLNR